MSTTLVGAPHPNFIAQFRIPIRASYIASCVTFAVYTSLAVGVNFFPYNLCVVRVWVYLRYLVSSDLGLAECCSRLPVRVADFHEHSNANFISLRRHLTYRNLWQECDTLSTPVIVSLLYSVVCAWYSGSEILPEIELFSCHFGL